MTDDPSSVADALADRLVAWCDWMEHDYPNPKQSLPDRCDDMRTAARLLREHADTADRLHRWEMSDALQRDPDVQQQFIDSLTAERDEARARLTALTDAIGDPNRLAWWADNLLSAQISENLPGLLLRIAAAVQPPDNKEPT